jgi:hypothetical protein
LERIKGALGEAATCVSDHNVLRLTLEGGSALAWRMRRDQDLLSEQIGDMARGFGSVWIEKIENQLKPPKPETEASDARTELHKIMQELSSDEHFFARAVQDVEELVTDLPPEIRAGFGDTGELRAVFVEQLLSSGIEDISARMMANPAAGES